MPSPTIRLDARRLQKIERAAAKSRVELPALKPEDINDAASLARHLTRAGNHPAEFRLVAEHLKNGKKVSSSIFAKSTVFAALAALQFGRSGQSPVELFRHAWARPEGKAIIGIWAGLGLLAVKTLVDGTQRRKLNRVFNQAATLAQGSTFYPGGAVVKSPAQHR